MKTIDFWTNIENCIFFTTDTVGEFEVEWDALTFDGYPVTGLDFAIEVVRTSMTNINVGLANYEQMQLGNAQWTNF